MSAIPDPRTDGLDLDRLQALAEDEVAQGNRYGSRFSATTVLALVARARQADELADRLVRALSEITAMAEDARKGSDYDTMRRLRGKAEGIGLAIDYLRGYDDGR